jgi:PEP-CTERM motif
VICQFRSKLIVSSRDFFGNLEIMKRTLRKSLLAFTLLATAGVANAGLSFSTASTATRTEIFDNIVGLPNLGLSTSVNLGSLITDQLGTITFTYLGQESGYTDSFHLNVNGTNLLESNPVGTSVSAVITNLGAINFSFEGNTGKFAVNGGTWASGTSIGLIGKNLNVSSGGAKGSYAYVLGYNDSAGAATLGDWDDFVVGVKFTPTTPVPEPETYAMLMAGLGLMGVVASRRKKSSDPV